MTTVTLKGISSELHRALKRRAVGNNRSTEAEIKAILEQTALPPTRVRIGSELAALGRNFDGIDLETSRDGETARAAVLE